MAREPKDKLDDTKDNKQDTSASVDAEDLESEVHDEQNLKDFDSNNESSEHSERSTDHEQESEQDKLEEIDDKDKDQKELSIEEKLSLEVTELKDKYVRLQAEWDNFRKRTNAQRAEERSRASEVLVTNLLPVVDDIERAIEHGDSSSEQAMLEGIKAIHNKFIDILSRQGLEEIAPKAGDAFDIELHQAVSKVEDDSMPDESVSELYQKGYKMGDKIIRSAMVAVTTGGAKRQ